jgi:hypothetical protein
MERDAMTAVPRPTPNQPRRASVRLTDPSQIATAAGAVTLAVGTALATKPAPTSRLLGLGLSDTAARALGAIDLAVAPKLITGQKRYPWMALRAALNLGIVARYRSQIRGGAGASAKFGFVLMAVLTLVDGAAAFSLARKEQGLSE